MRYHVVGNEVLVPRQQDFFHHVALVAVVPADAFRAQVVKAVRLGHVAVLPPVQCVFAVVLQHLVALHVEFQPHLPAGFEVVGLFPGQHVTHQPHQAGFAAAHRAGQQDAFAKVDAQLLGVLPVLQEVYQQGEDQPMVFGVNPESFAVHLFARSFQELEAVFEAKAVRGSLCPG